ncbi:MAG TPA: hypothetical protein VF201_03865 [Nitrolancea sp.]
MRDSTSALSKLNSAQKVFELRWLRTRTVWDDAVQRAFEREHLEPMMKQIGATQAELEQLLQVVAQARRTVH